jgi:hypothetical protein
MTTDRIGDFDGLARSFERHLRVGSKAQETISTAKRPCPVLYLRRRGGLSRGLRVTIEVGL